MSHSCGILETDDRFKNFDCYLIVSIVKEN
jgi:hypothetical protein